MDLVPKELKELSNLSVFKKAIKKWKPQYYVKIHSKSRFYLTLFLTILIRDCFRIPPPLLGELGRIDWALK